MMKKTLDSLYCLWCHYRKQCIEDHWKCPALENAKLYQLNLYDDDDEDTYPFDGDVVLFTNQDGSRVVGTFSERNPHGYFGNNGDFVSGEHIFAWRHLPDDDDELIPIDDRYEP